MFDKVLDILAVLTVPYVFITSILYNFGFLKKYYFMSLLILLIFWLVVCMRDHNNIILPNSYIFLGAVTGIIVSTSTISTYILFKKEEMYNIDWIYFVYVDAAALCIAMMLILCRRNAFELGMRVLSAFVYASGIYGIIAHVIKLIISAQDYEKLEGARAYSIYENPIPAGQIMLMFLWIPFSIRYDESDEKKRVRDVLLRVIVYVPFIILTKSRSAWFGLLFSTAVWLIIYRKEHAENWSKLTKKNRYVFSSAIAVITILGGWFAVKLIAPRFEDFTNTQPYVVRTSYIKYTLEMIAESSILRIIFGHGSGSCREMIANSPCYVEPYNICDNAYLSMFYEWGIVAVIAVIVIDILAIKLIKNSAKTRERNIGVYCAYALIACMLPIFFYEAQMWVMVGTLMAIFIAGAVGAKS